MTYVIRNIKRNLTGLFMLIVICVLVSSCHTRTQAQSKPMRDAKYQAQIEDALKKLKDKDTDIKCYAVYALGELGAKEYSKEIAELLGSDEARVRATAIKTLGMLGAKDYAKDIAKLLNDDYWCQPYDDLPGPGDWKRRTEVGSIAMRILREWGYGVIASREGAIDPKVQILYFEQRIKDLENALAQIEKQQGKKSSGYITIQYELDNARKSYQIYLEKLKSQEGNKKR